MIKRIPVNILFFGFAVISVFGFLQPAKHTIAVINIHSSGKGNSSEIGYPSVFPISDADKKWIEDKINEMTLLEKCAQMVFPRVPARDYVKDTAGYARMVHYVKELKVGGLLFSAGDAVSEAADINKMQAIADIPLLISADFESGPGMRLSDGTNYPYNMAITATGNSGYAYKMGVEIAKESETLGVYQNYAPDVDVNDNPDNSVIGIRSYSENKDTVTKYAEAFIRGIQSRGMIATVKHFPGHGNTKTDSHFNLPVINEDSTSLMNNELIPFVKAIQNGVKSVMVGHLAVPSIESDESLPATLSKKIVTGLLINKLGFDGLIVTDAMNMQALTRYHSGAEAAAMAVEAGNDILIMPSSVELTINSIFNAVQSGKIDTNRINHSVRKILAAKLWLKLREKRHVDISEVKEMIQNESGRRLAREIAQKSITLVRNTRNVVPIFPSRYKRPISIVFSYRYEGDSLLTFQKLVEENFNNSLLFVLNEDSKPADFTRVLRHARNSDLIIIPYMMRAPSDIESHAMFEKYKKVINKLLVTSAPVVMLSFGDPYLLSRYKNVKTYLAAFSDVSVSQKAMMKALLGEADIAGSLPVSLPDMPFKAGFGIKKKALNTLYFRNKRN